MEVITIVQIGGFALAVMGCIGGTIMIMVRLVDRWLMSRFADIGSRLDEIGQSINRDIGELKRVEQSLMDLRTTLPEKYVLRNDYLRGQQMLESKLDALADKIARRRASDTDQRGT